MRVKSQPASLETQNRNLTHVERVLNCCALAKRLEKAGEFRAASEALKEFWPDLQSPPLLDDLPKHIQAELLLRAGALAGWIGSVEQTNDGQENAKNLITRSIEVFVGIGEADRVAEARAELALCYWREGAFEEARINLAEALSDLRNEGGDLKASVLIRAGVVEVTAGRSNEALRLYEESAPLVERSPEHALKGSLHINIGAVLSSLA